MAHLLKPRLLKGRSRTNVPSLCQELRNFGPEALFCPADKKHKPAADWAAIEANGISYEFVGTGEDSYKPYIKCPVHGFIMCVGRKITTPDGTMANYLRDSDEWVEFKLDTNEAPLIRLKNGKWADIKSVFPDKDPKRKRPKLKKPTQHRREHRLIFCA